MKLKCTCGHCSTCRKREWYRKNRSVKAREKSQTIYPKSSLVLVWECSDGSEFNTEVDALRYELDLFRRG